MFEVLRLFYAIFKKKECVLLSIQILWDNRSRSPSSSLQRHECQHHHRLPRHPLPGRTRLVVAGKGRLLPGLLLLAWTTSAWNAITPGNPGKVDNGITYASLTSQESHKPWNTGTFRESDYPFSGECQPTYCSIARCVSFTYQPSSMSNPTTRFPLS